MAFSYYTDKAPMGRRVFRAFNGSYAPLDDFEVGLFRSEWAGPVKLDTSGLSVKYVLPSLSRHGTELALGGVAFQGDVDGWTGQFSVSQRLTAERAKRSFDLHAGLQYSTWRGGRFRGSDLVPFIGVSGRLANWVSLSAEFRERENWGLKNAHAFGLHFKPHRQWTLTIGGINTGFSKSLRPYFAISWGTSAFVPR